MNVMMLSVGLEVYVLLLVSWVFVVASGFAPGSNSEHLWWKRCGIDHQGTLIVWDSLLYVSVRVGDMSNQCLEVRGPIQRSVSAPEGVGLPSRDEIHQTPDRLAFWIKSCEGCLEVQVWGKWDSLKIKLLNLQNKICGMCEGKTSYYLLLSFCSLPIHKKQ